MLQLKGCFHNFATDWKNITENITRNNEKDTITAVIADHHTGGNGTNGGTAGAHTRGDSGRNRTERDKGVQGSTLRRATRGRTQMEGTAARTTVAGREKDRGLRPQPHATADLRRHELRNEADERGLPVP